ncbi:hypothetical protein K438DRAFT_2012119 [Mycena galopus ATCC 62051]|nr:hypothetical protein K438DRAFT_2012119 [Mycena galopus ATCC 62051]
MTTTISEALAPFFGKETSLLLGQNGARTDASDAGLLNGLVSHVHGYDDTHLPTIIHPTGPVASALFSQTEALSSVKGDDFIAWPSHIKSTIGSTGAARAVGKLMHLESTPMQYAISIATQMMGLREMFGTETKSFHVRHATKMVAWSRCWPRAYPSSLQALETKRG